jgi:PAS domain S-box-containing protein
MKKIIANILIVDDDPGTRKTFGRILKLKGYNVESAGTFSDAVSLAETKFFNVAVVDINLPDATGLDVLKALRIINKDTVVLIITAYASIDTSIEALNNGAYSYITKPVNMDEVLILIERALEKQRLLIENRLFLERLKESEERYRKLMDNIGDAMFLQSLDGRFVDVNEQACKSLGYSRNELLSMHVWDIEVGWSQRNLEELYKVLHKSLPTTQEGLQRRKDGSTFPVEVRVGPFWWKNDNYMLVLARNITERKKIEEALITSKKLFKDISFSMTDWIWEVDLEGRYRYCSEKVQEVLGYAVNEVIGKTPFDFMPLEETEKVKKIFSRALKQKKPIVDLENWNITKDGKKRCFLTNGTPFFDNKGNLKGYRGVDKDITERKKIEEALEKRIIALTHPIDDISDVFFENLFNIEEIQLLQDQFAKATGVASIISRPDGVPITNPSNFCRLCRDIIRPSKIGCKNCQKSDKILGKPNPDGPIVQPCVSGGLWDAGASIMVGGKHIATWLVGQVRNEAQSEEKILLYAEEIGANKEDFLKAYREVAVMPEEQFNKIAQALFTMANQLSKIAYQNVQQARFITERKRTEKQLKKSTVKIENAHKHAIYMLALASEYKDPETGEHIKNIVQITTELALKLGIESEQAKQMGADSILHDLGKLGISDYILLKPGKLTDNEYETMKQHTIIGAKIIGDDEWFIQACQIAMSHHEKWDGSGYPEGLKGEAIPLPARIVAVADEFDALISRRPYKEAWSVTKAIDEIKLESGKHFDPKVVEAFLSLHKKGKLEK